MPARLPLLLLATLLAGEAAAQSAMHHVQGARVHLRAQAAAAAPSLALLPINTPVRLLRREQPWCEVEREAPAQRGFMPCELLGERPVTLEEVQAQLKDEKLPAARRRDLLGRAFWLAPSFARWAAFGRSLSWPGPTPAMPRPPRHAEFDAMKQLLASGTVVVRQPMPWVVEEVNAEDGPKALRRAPLPQAKPSFFGSGDLAAFLPSGLFGGTSDGAPPRDDRGRPVWMWSETGDQFTVLDALSQRAQASVRMQVLAPSEINRIDEFNGIWDTGTIGVEFANAARIETVAANDGRGGFVPVTALTYAMGAGGCFGGSVSVHAPPPPRGARGMSDFAAAWVGRAAPAQPARMTARMLKGRTQWEALQVRQIDVDGDGQADFVVYEGRYEPQASGDGHWQRVYANIAGQWTLVFDAREEDCT